MIAPLTRKNGCCLAARILIFANAAIWLSFAIYTVLGGHPSYTGTSVLRWVFAAGAAAVAAGLILGVTPALRRRYRSVRAELAELDFAAGEESLEVRLFDEQQIPWSELAFPTIGRTLEYFFADRLADVYPLRNEPIAPPSAHKKV